MDLAAASSTVDGRRGVRATTIRRALALTEPAKKLEIEPTASAAQLIGAALAQRTLDLLHYEVLIRLRADPEDVHHARSSIRRLRAILKGFRPSLDRRWADTLREDLRWFAGELAAVRDVDVALAALLERATLLSSDDERYLAQTLEPLRENRRVALERLLETLDGSGYRSLLDALENAVIEPRLLDDAPCAGELAVTTLAKTTKRVRKTIKRANAGVASNELHHARIVVRNGRYAAEACESVVHKPARRLARHLEKLQEVLGAINDANFVQDRLRSTLGNDPQASLVAGQLIALEAVEGEKARDCWRSLRRRVLKKAWV